VAKVAREVHAVMKDVQTASETATDGGEVLDGHRLPATKGGTGYEDPVGPDGRLTAGDVGATLTFPSHVSHGKEYQDYYITMRWEYVKWSWDGTASALDSGKYSWYSSKPRKVLVTNPRTKKSIITVIAEAGPAPWTGARGGQSENGYSSPQRYTPSNYTGRVSGLPPVAIDALEAKQTENGEGDKLLYAWAPDQNATPGPTDDTASDNTSVGNGSACVCRDSVENVKAGVATGTMKKFIEAYGQTVFDVGKQYGIPYDAILAQIGLESAWGNAVPGGNSNNLFGIKAYPGWTGETVSSGTQEDDGSGGMTSITADFIKFNSIEEGIEGYAQFIHRNSRYKTALKYPKNPVRYIEEIKKAGYATDSRYVSKLVGILKTVQQYIADNNLFPPSSEVEPDNAPPNAQVSSGTPVSSGGCADDSGGSSASSGDIIGTAIKLSWPEDRGTTPKPEYADALREFNPSVAGMAADCGVFVSTVMRASGADKNYPPSGTWIQEPYMSSSSKYEFFGGNSGARIRSTADLEPGDILVVNAGSGVGGSGHILIWLGPNPTGKNIASASLGTRAGNLGNLTSLNDESGRGWYSVGRLK